MSRDEALEGTDVDEDTHLYERREEVSLVSSCYGLPRRNEDISPRTVSAKSARNEVEESASTHLINAAHNSINNLPPERPVHNSPIPNRKHRLPILHDPPSVVPALAGVFLDDSDDVAQSTTAGTFDLAPEFGGEVAGEGGVEVGGVHD
jgi:hypothetical protein